MMIPQKNFEDICDSILADDPRVHLDQMFSDEELDEVPRSEDIEARLQYLEDRFTS